MASVLLLLIAVGIPIAFIYIFFIRIPQKTKEAFNVFSQQLAASGFKTSKRIITPDYTPAIMWFGDMYVGIWIDYSAEKLAVRTSRKGISPQVLNFKDIQKLESIGGPGGFSVDNRAGQINELAKDIIVRIVFNSENGGVNAIQLSLWHFGFYGRPNANSKLYQRLLDCSRAICDELGNIIQINAGK